MDFLKGFSIYFWQSLSFILMPLIIGSSIYIFQKEKIYRYPAQGWLDIKSHPLPEDIGNFIATDGKKVEVIYRPSWGPHGKVIFDPYNKTYVKYWQPLPEAP